MNTPNGEALKNGADPTRVHMPHDKDDKISVGEYMRRNNLVAVTSEQQNFVNIEGDANFKYTSDKWRCIWPSGGFSPKKKKMPKSE